MERFAGIKVENAAEMNEIERLEAAFTYITETSIKHILNELELAKAINDEEKKKICHIQIGMYRHAQSIFSYSKNYAADKQWQA